MGPPQAVIYRSGRPWTWPFFDLTFYDVFEVRILIGFDKCSRIHGSRPGDLLSTRRHPFGPPSLPVPNRPEVVPRVYLPEWDTWPYPIDPRPGAKCVKYDDGQQGGEQLLSAVRRAFDFDREYIREDSCRSFDSRVVIDRIVA